MRYARRLVAFIDVLGFSDLIRSARSVRRAKSLIGLFDFVMAEKLQWGDQDWRSRDYSARVFSDCVCMTAPPTRPGLNRLLFRVASAQLHLASVGIYVRGGIDFGRHHESTNLLFSEGLLNAYSIENRRAIYPRVVLSGEVLHFIETCRSRRIIYGLLLADSDDEWFVDYLWLLSLDDYPGDRFEALKLRVMGERSEGPT
jgi:hypothetical protein